MKDSSGALKEEEGVDRASDGDSEFDVDVDGDETVREEAKSCVGASEVQRISDLRTRRYSTVLCVEVQYSTLCRGTVQYYV